MTRSATAAMPVQPAGLVRRVAAMIYDGLLVFALWMVGTALLLPFTHGEAVAAGNLLYQLYLVAIAFAFFAGFWVGAGRTLGMQAWRMRIVDGAGGRPRLAQAAIRFAAALLSWLPAGLGFLWSLFDPERLAWHDRLSKTRLIVEPAPQRKPRS